MLAITIWVKLAIWKSHQEVIVLVHDFFATSACYVDSVRIQKLLWYQGELGQDCWVPLHDVFLGIDGERTFGSK